MVPSLPLLSCEWSVSVKENPDRKKMLMMQYKAVVELFQKLHLQIYASQFMTSLIHTLLYLESVKR